MSSRAKAQQQGRCSVIFNSAPALHAEFEPGDLPDPSKPAAAELPFIAFSALRWRWAILNLERLQQHAVAAHACTLLSEKMMTKPNPDFPLIWPILNQTARRDTKAATGKRAAP